VQILELAAPVGNLRQIIPVVNQLRQAKIFLFD
jgi:hypothetical protein